MKIAERIHQIGEVEYELSVRDESTGYFGSWFCRACWKGGVVYDLMPFVNDVMTQAEQRAIAHHESAHPNTNQRTRTDLPMKKCMLIPLYGDGNNYNVESQLPIIPRVGDHIELDDPHDKGKGLMFRVVAVGFANDERVEFVDVYLRPDAPLHEMITRWSKA